MLFNEPKLLKSIVRLFLRDFSLRFSALQRAEIAEIRHAQRLGALLLGFSALQRAEIAEMSEAGGRGRSACGFQCSSTSRNC